MAVVRAASSYNHVQPADSGRFARFRGLLLTLLAAALTVTAAGCREPQLYQYSDDYSDTAFQAPAQDWPAPRRDTVPAVGSAKTLDIATWNIEWFPQSATTTEQVANLIASLDLDIIAVQEIADAAAFDELAQRLPEHEAVLSEHVYDDGTYQKVGIIYRTALFEPIEHELLFPGQRYAFPRPPLQVRLAVNTESDASKSCMPPEITVIAVHLKAGRKSGDAARRKQALTELEAHMHALISDPATATPVMLLGDFNEVLNTTESQEVWAPLLGNSDAFRIHTTPLSQAGEHSYLPSRRLLDHIVTSGAAGARVPALSTAIPRIDRLVERYELDISDHLPVISRMPYCLE